MNGTPTYEEIYVQATKRERSLKYLMCRSGHGKFRHDLEALQRCVAAKIMHNNVQIQSGDYYVALKASDIHG